MCKNMNVKKIMVWDKYFQEEQYRIFLPIMFCVSASLVLIALALLIHKLINISKFWEHENIIHEPSWPIVGNMGSVLLGQNHVLDVTIDLYRKYSNYRYVGLMQFTHPMLLIRDIDLIKQLNSTDFEYFHDHFAFAVTEKDPLLSKSLVCLTGKDWQKMRGTLSPAFSIGKMKNMHPLMTECAESFVRYFNTKDELVVDIKDATSRFVTDIMASAFFGIKINSLEEKRNEFFEMGKRLNLGVFLLAKMIVLARLPFLVDFLGLQFFPTDVVKFFRLIIKNNMDKRKKHGIVRSDLIQLFIENQSYNVEQNSQLLKLTDDDIVAQAIMFFFAGGEPTMTIICFLLHGLATNPEVQKKLHEEIDSSRHKQQYEVLVSMKYLDQVVCEGLRLWTPGFQTERTCTKDYVIRPRNPDEKEVHVKKGTSILIPMAAVHRDPQFYPNPEKFDPDRFSDENKSKIVPGSYIPFGVGPRSCIVTRFTILNLKTFLVQLLSTFEVISVKDTPSLLKVRPMKITLEPEDFKLGFRRRKVYL